MPVLSPRIYLHKVSPPYLSLFVWKRGSADNCGSYINFRESCKLVYCSVESKRLYEIVFSISLSHHGRYCTRHTPTHTQAESYIELSKPSYKKGMRMQGLSLSSWDAMNPYLECLATVDVESRDRGRKKTANRVVHSLRIRHEALVSLPYERHDWVPYHIRIRVEIV